MRSTSVALLACLALGAVAPAQEGGSRSVRATVQTRPGGPIVEGAEISVHEVPVDPPLVPAEKAELPENDLVLGMVVDGQAVAFPVRYLALSEVVNSRVGKTPVAPTW